MKRILSAILAICMIAMLAPVVFADDSAGTQNVFGQQTVSISKLGAFEGSYAGYETSYDIYDGEMVRIIRRTGADNTSTGFNFYHWSTPLPDVDGNPIPLSTANYIIIDYYYHSPDESPALEGNRIGWIQGRVVPEDNTSKITEFTWSTTMLSRNGMVANKWDKLVISVDDQIGGTKSNILRSGKEYYLHQMKLFPLQGDMGKNDVLYLGDITIQSWDPEGTSGISERNVRFFGNVDDAKYPEKAISVVKTKDIEIVTIPEFTGKAPENSEFATWMNTLDGKEYKPGEKIQLLAGKDLDFIPVFNYVFDFTTYEDAYINGYEDGTFKPQGNVTRAEAVKMLASIVNPDGKITGTTAFADVKAKDWFYDSVTALEALGVLDIWEENLEPNKMITRSELVEMVYAVSDTDIDSMKLSSISDVDADERYYDAVMFAVAAGIITGYDDGTFKPDGNITRAETVTVINRMIGRTYSGTGETSFSDIADHWAKGQIIASSTAKSAGTWTVSSEKEYVLEGTSAEEYIKALHAQSKNLSGDAIRRGIDTISEQMKKDIMNTPNTAELYPDRFGGNTYYVSEKNGNDDNNGKSPETAVKTIAGLFKKLRFPGPGTAILFERGGIYRGQIPVQTGLTYGSYGTGDKPVISGSLKNYADPALWKETDVPDVYAMTEKITNVGVIVFDHATDAHGNYDDLYGKNRINGWSISHYSGLANDLEFFSCADTLYLCSKDGNPGSRFKSIEMGNRTDVFDGDGTNILIDNVHVKHTGSHGIGLGSVNNLRVTNCEFSWLGGSLLGNYGETTVQYGNAVEVYGHINGYYVKNNWMWQIYDTAITHQGKDLRMDGIEYTGNLMEYVHWGIECWIKPEAKEKSTLLQNYLAQYNVLRNGGYGWGSIVTDRQGSARLYSFSTVDAENNNMSSRFNIIDRCSGYLLDIDKRSSETFDCNIYVQDEGKTLGGLKGQAAATSLNAAQLISKYLKDKDPVVVFIPSGKGGDMPSV